VDISVFLKAKMKIIDCYYSGLNICKQVGADKPDIIEGFQCER
jgi:hypothetical protein